MQRPQRLRGDLSETADDRDDRGDRDERLELPPDAMRTLGYAVVDMIVDHHQGLADRPAANRSSRPELERRLREPPPRRGTDPARVLEQLQRDVFDHHMHVDHPRFFGFVPSPSNFVSALGNALVAGMNPFVGTWLAGSGPAALELVTIDWLRELCGLEPEAGGLFTSGGSMANLIALAVARHRMLPDGIDGAVVYLSDQTHHSVARGLRVLGFVDDQIRVLPTTEAFELDPATLAAAIAADRSAGRRPFCVVANAGTTNTGAVDPLPQLAALCSEHGLWLHADGAYGAAAKFSPRAAGLLDGLELVDSLSLDPHKWLFQPFEIGCVLLKNRRWLRDCYQFIPEYMQDTDGDDEEINFANHGIQLTRSLRAVKLWMSFKVFGLDAVASAIDRGIELAEHVEACLRRESHWQVVTPAQLAVVTFRYCPESLAGEPDEVIDEITRGIIDKMYADGFAMLSTTSIGGRPVLHMCTINPRTTEDDLEQTLDRLARFGRALAAAT